jgi:hypothetical protein
MSPGITIDRFMRRVDRDSSGCWLWAGPISERGYGYVSTGSRRTRNKGYKRAHRIAYLLFVGPIPDGLQLDHLCRVRHCVNPGHLEPVTREENQRRGLSGNLTTHCPHGHGYTPENTRISRSGRRNCRACQRIRKKNRRLAAAEDALSASFPVLNAPSGAAGPPTAGLRPFRPVAAAQRPPAAPPGVAGI